MKLSGKVAFCGMISCLSVVIMLLTVIPTLEIGLPALAGALLMLPVIECGMRWGIGGYCTVSVLSLLLAPSLESKLLFLVFFGFYPILKALIERLQSAPARWMLKLAVFNVTVGGLYYILLRFTMLLDANDFTFFGVYLPVVLLGIGNVVFVLYDIALTRIVTMYLRVWQRKVHKLFRF